ncbi:MAG: hypothetical protein R2795_25260 [Saprospiraceae bacterium]
MCKIRQKYIQLLRDLVVLTVLLLQLGTISLAAQTTIHLKDVFSKQPINGVFWQTDTGGFGVSDTGGRCAIGHARQSSQTTIRFSHLGYQDTALVLTLLHHNSDTFYLHPKVYELPEVFVGTGKGEDWGSRPPRKLVREALRRIDRNYTTEEQLYGGVYIEALLSGECPIKAQEVVGSVILGGYGEKHRHRTAWRTGWDRYVVTRDCKKGKSRELGVHHPEGIQQYPAISDRYSAAASRIMLYTPPCDYYPRFSDGLLSALSLDKVKLGYDYFDADGMKNYEYELVDTVFVQGRACFHIRFHPSDDVPTAYHGINKSSQTGIFSGDCYITLKELAIVQFSAVNTKAVIPNNCPGGYKAPPQSISTTVTYLPNKQGRWRLHTITNGIRSVVDASTTAHRALILFEDAADGFPFAPPVDASWYYQCFNHTLLKIPNSYDLAFWETFTQTPWHKELIGLLPKSIAMPPVDDPAYYEPFNFEPVAIPAPKWKGEKRGGFAYLEEPSDETLAYLDHENRYYEQFMRDHSKIVGQVAANSSLAAMGITRLSSEEELCPHTTIQEIDGKRGIYQITATNTTLVAPLGEQRKIFRLSFFELDDAGAYAAILYETATNTNLLEIRNRSGLLDTLRNVDDVAWQGDTLYAATYNDLFRVAYLYRWTKSVGWHLEMEEKAPPYEYMLHRNGDGVLELYAESLIAYEKYGLEGGVWRCTMPRSQGEDVVGFACADLLAEMVGQGVAVDFLEDCKTTSEGTLAIARSRCLYELWFRAAGGNIWQEVKYPSHLNKLTFAAEEGLALYGEGVGISSEYYVLKPPYAHLRLEQETCDFSQTVSG